LYPLRGTPRPRDDKKCNVSDLADFLLARIDDDEDQARYATTGPWENVRTSDRSDGWNVEARGADGTHYDVAVDHAHPAEGACNASDAAHVARWDPTRVLAVCEAKRRIVERCRNEMEAEGNASFAEDVLRLLALPYAGHRDYRP
jgi:hypothetical protein